MRALAKKGKFPIERKGQGVAGILTDGTYKEPYKQDRDFAVHHSGGCSQAGPRNKALGL